jgi:hypothetical protein
MMTLDQFQPKAVSGLYSFDHFEHPNGAFIQRSVSTPRYFVFRDPAGGMTRFENFAALRDAVTGYKE